MKHQTHVIKILVLMSNASDSRIIPMCSFCILRLCRFILNFLFKFLNRKFITKIIIVLYSFLHAKRNCLFFSRISFHQKIRISVKISNRKSSPFELSFVANVCSQLLCAVSMVNRILIYNNLFRLSVHCCCQIDF